MKRIVMAVLVCSPLMFGEPENPEVETPEAEHTHSLELSKGYESALAKHQDSLGRLDQVHNELRVAREELEMLLTRIEELKRVHEQEHLREIELRKECADFERKIAENIDLKEVEKRAEILTEEAQALQADEKAPNEE